MALVRPTGSTYARASVQVTRKWRIWRRSFYCWPLIKYFVWNTVLWEHMCEVNPQAMASLFFYFFFSCIAERARSIVGQLVQIECRIFTRPSQKQNKPTQTKTEHNPPNQQTKTTHKVQWNFAKRCETKVKRLAPLSPSCDLFHHVAILHAIRVIFRCPSCLRLPFLAQAGLSHPARVDVAWAGKCPLWSATSLHNVP